MFVIDEFSIIMPLLCKKRFCQSVAENMKSLKYFMTKRQLNSVPDAEVCQYRQCRQAFPNCYLFFFRNVSFIIWIRISPGNCNIVWAGTSKSVKTDCFTTWKWDTYNQYRHFYPEVFATYPGTTGKSGTLTLTFNRKRLWLIIVFYKRLDRRVWRNNIKRLLKSCTESS